MAKGKREDFEVTRPLLQRILAQMTLLRVEYMNETTKRILEAET